VINPDQRADHLQRLTGAGIDPTTAESARQLEIRTNSDVYIRGPFRSGSDAASI
jgi:hypothetical protein